MPDTMSHENGDETDPGTVESDPVLDLLKGYLLDQREDLREIPKRVDALGDTLGSSFRDGLRYQAKLNAVVMVIMAALLAAMAGATFSMRYGGLEFLSQGGAHAAETTEPVSDPGAP